MGNNLPRKTEEDRDTCVEMLKSWKINKNISNLNISADTKKTGKQ